MQNRPESTTVGLLAAIGLSLVHASLNAGSPSSQISAKAGASYKGDGLAVSPSAQGAQLRCVFQRLEGEATREGLWLTSTVTNGLKGRFRVIAASVRRQSSSFSSSSSSSTLQKAGTVSLD